MPGTSRRAGAGDSISSMVGTSEPQAIGNFMRANNLTTDRLKAGGTYFVPASADSYGDQQARGQGALNAGNARIAARQEAAAQAASMDEANQQRWDAMQVGAWSGRTAQASAAFVVPDSQRQMSYGEQMRNVGQFLANGAVGAAELIGGGIYNYGIRLVGGAASAPYLMNSVDAAVSVQAGMRERFGYDMRSAGAQAISQAMQPAGQWLQSTVVGPARAYSENLVGDGATSILGGGIQAGLEIAGVVSGLNSVGRTLGSADSVFVAAPTPNMMGQRGIMVGGQWIETVTPEMRARFAGNGVLDPISNTFRPLAAGERMAVDHLFPSAEIVKMPGFNTLTKQEMTNIIQDTIGLDNLQPLPKSFNSSKGSSTNWTEYKGQALDPGYARDLRIRQFEVQQKIGDQIRSYQQHK